jgi:hypothetical protein
MVNANTVSKLLLLFVFELFCISLSGSSGNWFMVYSGNFPAVLQQMEPFWEM